ncbi:MAG TPA: hypothetical protein VFO94_10645 [Gammaproteobacteria bacterium]|nr:hypothetical protein [Gammaproteobacteria bacterium]
MLWIVALAVVGVRLTGAHLHLCLDGSEPFASVRITDEQPAAGGGIDHATHDDRDLDVIGAATLAKKDVGDNSADVPVVDLPVVALLPPPQRIRGEVEPQSPVPRLPPLFHPLLRGPPA